MPEERALRGRGEDEEGLLARPERPRRCTFPITALRVMPPSSAAIWLADSPSAHNFLRSSTLSSVQPIWFSPWRSKRWVESNPVVRRHGGHLTLRFRDELEIAPLARDVVLAGQKATIWSG